MGPDHQARVAIDRAHTTAEDPGTWFPLPALRRAAARRIGQVAPRFHGAPTNRSHRVTLEKDCPEIVSRCRADGVDAALLERWLTVQAWQTPALLDAEAPEELRRMRRDARP